MVNERVRKRSSYKVDRCICEANDDKSCGKVKRQKNVRTEQTTGMRNQTTPHEFDPKQHNYN